jgi:hypothetical protein
VDPHHLDADPDADPDPDLYLMGGSGFLFDADAHPDADADPGYQNDANPCGSGSTTLIFIEQ